jgi:hypothetical protein
METHQLPGKSPVGQDQDEEPGGGSVFTAHNQQPAFVETGWPEAVDRQRLDLNTGTANRQRM